MNVRIYARSTGKDCGLVSVADAAQIIARDCGPNVKSRRAAIKAELLAGVTRETTHYSYVLESEHT